MTQNQITFTNVTNQSLTTTGALPPIEVTQYSGGSLQCIFDYTSGTSAGSIKIQVSNDGVSYADYANSSQGFNSTNATNPIVYIFSIFAVKFVRIFVTNVSGTGGLLTVKCTMLSQVTR